MDGHCDLKVSLPRQQHLRVSVRSSSLYPAVRYTETILSLIFFRFNSSARLSFTVLFSFRHPISYLPFSPLLPAVLDSICHVSSSSLFD